MSRKNKEKMPGNKPQTEKKGKQGKIIIVAAVLLSLIAIIVGVLIIKNSPANRIKSQFATAESYLSEQDYERAIAAYEEILRIDPKNVEAYLGWANVCRKQGKIEKALRVLREGYDLTDDKSLVKKMEDLEDDLQLAKQSDESETEENPKDSGIGETEGSESPEDPPKPVEEEIEPWRSAYFSFLSDTEYELFSYYMDIYDLVNCHYALCYLDDDEIPEILCCTDSERISSVFFYHDGNVQIMDGWSGDGAIYYVPREGKICQESGMGGFYYYVLYEFDGQNWRDLAGADGSIRYSDYDGSYFWGDEAISSEEKFHERFMEIGYDSARETNPDYNLDYCGLITWLMGLEEAETEEAKIKLACMQVIREIENKRFTSEGYVNGYALFNLGYVNDDDVPEFIVEIMYDGPDGASQYPITGVYAYNEGRYQKVKDFQGNAFFSKKDYHQGGEGVGSEYTPVFDASKPQYYTDYEGLYLKNGNEISESEFEEFVTSLGERNLYARYYAREMIFLLLN